jgi:hypothetical protein
LNRLSPSAVDARDASWELAALSRSGVVEKDWWILKPN